MTSQQFARGTLLGGSDSELHAAMLDRADEACHDGDLVELANAARGLIPLVPKAISYDLVAVAELAAFDGELSRARWRQLRRDRLGIA
jgi:hypothetical protein